MTILEQAQRLAGLGRSAEAIELVRGAAANDDVEAIFAVAMWRIFGLNGPRDLIEAHDLLDRAAAVGHIESIRTKAILICNGTGCQSDPARAAEILESIEDADPYAAAQLAVTRKMPPAEEIDRIPVEDLSEAPLIRCVRGLLTPEECGYLITLAGPHLQPSFVIDPLTGRRIPHPIRTSFGMSFGPTQEDVVINALNRRLANVTGTEEDWGEPLHMLKYEGGQEYRPHVDALPGVENQRHWTVLIYLNEGYAGGATRFDTVDIEFSGRTGDALIFRNVDDQGRGDPATRHAGLPVTSGTKWLATRWIRQRRYHPWESAT